MNEEKERNQKIDHFLLGQMTEEEASDFNKQLQADPVLRKEVALQEKIIQGLKAHQNLELKSRLKEIHKEIHAPKKKNLTVIWRYAAVAASILLIAAVSIWILQHESPQQQLALAYYEPYELYVTRNTNDLLLSEAASLYNKGEYKAALPKLDSLVDKIPDSINYQLAMGICLWELGQTRKAQQTFENIIESDNPLFVDQARWYLGLLLIRQNKPNRAKTHLNDLIQNKETDKYEEAIEILQNL